jgi:predicted Zn-dependent protease
METAADKEALKALVSLYGHANGAIDLFNLLTRLHQDDALKQPTFFVSHPLGKNRIKHIEEIATKHHWSLDKAVTPLPHAFKKWLDFSLKETKI